MNPGDTVMLTDMAASGLNKRQNKSAPIDWAKRVGVVKRWHTNGRVVGVIWLGRASLDWYPPKALRVLTDDAPIPEQPVPRHGPGVMKPRRSVRRHYGLVP